MSGSHDRTPWLVELSARPPARLALEADVTLVSLLWDLGTTGVAEVDGHLVAGFSGGDRAALACDRLRSLVDGVRARPAGLADPGSVGPDGPAPATEVSFSVGTADHVVTVVAGTTFGHGRHPTTRLALDLLCSALGRIDTDRHGGRRMLDLGTGSGILAVAGAGAGVESVIAVDVDPACRSVVEANAAANGVDVDVVIGNLSSTADVDAAGMITSPGSAGTTGGPSGADQAPDGAHPLVRPFDVIVANLLLADHADVAEAVAAVAADRAMLVVSGYLIDQVGALLDLYPDFTPVATSTIDDWAGHLLALAPNPP